MPRSCSCIITHYYKSFKRASRELHENFKRDSRELQRASREFHESFKWVSSGFQKSFKRASRELLEPKHLWCLFLMKASLVVICVHQG